ncbi:hypothetical protein TNCV_4193511 [Trichonephila clavipes]|nr:hypothetical protein TNCV_4193511 [Trichonephila clavipes]
MLSKVYGESTMARSNVNEHQRFKEDPESIEYNGRVGPSSTSRNANNVPLASECVRKDHRETLEQIGEAAHFAKTLFEESIRPKRPHFVMAHISSARHAPALRSQLIK